MAYNIWMEMANGKRVPLETNMSISKAFDYVSMKRNDLKAGQKLLTQDSRNGMVDMIFTKDDSITPKEPIKAPLPPTGTTKNKSTSMASMPSMKKKQSKNFVPNMWGLKSQQLSKWLKDGKGTPKQRRLAYRILKSRRN